MAGDMSAVTLSHPEGSPRALLHTDEAVATLLRDLPIERRVESFASRVAAAIRTAAIPALDGFASFLRIRRGFQFGETIEPLDCGIYPVRIDRPGELVRVDLNLPVGVAGIENVRRLLHMELTPFIIGVGEIALKDTAEAGRLLRRRVRHKEAGHA